MMARPAPAGPGQVLFRGWVSDSSGHVVLQRSNDGHWVKVRWVPVHGHDFAVTVPTRPKLQRFRVRAGNSYSQIRVLQPAAPTRTQDACGKRPPKPGGPRWSCTFVDDFDAAALNPKLWLPEMTLVVGHKGGAQACLRDHPDNIAVGGGTLRLTVRKVEQEVRCGDREKTDAPYTAGGVNTYHRFSQAFGRFEARFKVTATDQPGLQEAFWLWPDVRYSSTVTWPLSGEIDIAETYSQHPDLAVPYLHYDVLGPQPGINTARNCEARRGVFNTYTLLWSAHRIEILVNGKTCLVNEVGPEAFRKKYIIGLTQMLGTGSNRYQGSAPLPATMTVDYVRVWR